MICGECNGSRACDVCDGYGDFLGAFSPPGIECEACDGSGQCPGCFGDGEIHDTADQELAGTEATA